MYKRNMYKRILIIMVFVCSFCFSGCGISKTNNRQDSEVLGGIKATVNITSSDDSTANKSIDDLMKALKEKAITISEDASIKKNGDNQVIIDLPLIYDIEVIEDLISSHELYFCTEADVVPSDKLLSTGKYIQINNGSSYDGYYRVWVTGDHVSNAEGTSYLDSISNTTTPIVTLSFNDEGTDLFFDMTVSSIAKTTYIIYDGSVISAPTVTEAISGGQAQITVDSIFDARLLAANIMYSNLEYDLEIVDYKVTNIED